MNLSDVKQDIHKWIEEFLEVPNPNLGGWSPCPYARNARLNQTYDVRLGTVLIDDLKAVCHTGMQSWEVIIYAYPIEKYGGQEFSDLIVEYTRDLLISQNLIALEDHPSLPEIVNGVCMNQGKYTLAIIQSLSDLNDRAEIIGKKGFYDKWPEEYLTELFRYRKDPR